VLRFSPTAWAKLLYFRDRKDTEVGGFGLSAKDDLLYIEEFVTVRQDVSVTSVGFDDEAVADFFDAQVDVGRGLEQFARVWLHTHPGDSPKPSATDEATFARVFGACEWAVMFVLAQNGQSYARLRFNVGPGGEQILPVEVDYARPFEASDQAAWEVEYAANVRVVTLTATSERPLALHLGNEDWEAYAWLDEFDDLDPTEQKDLIDAMVTRTQCVEEMEVFDVE
jgi:proteasome lid subunit RPN8/RPN11